jgi:hypothetical protein
MWVPDCAPRTPSRLGGRGACSTLGRAQGGGSDYGCPTPVSATYLFVAHGIVGRAACRCAASAAALRVANKPRRHRRHRPAPELGGERTGAGPPPNGLPGAGDLHARETGRQGRLVELGQGGLGAVGARGRTAAQPSALLLEGAHLDQPGRIGVEHSGTVEHGPAELELPRLQRPLDWTGPRFSVRR